MSERPGPSDVRPVQQRSYGNDWWGAKCRHCGGWLTKYDFSMADAITSAVSEPHTCRAAAAHARNLAAAKEEKF